MAGWWTISGALLLLAVVLAAYIFKINWITDWRVEGGGKRILGNYMKAKKRKLGKLPPVYPNGWFALLESSQLKRGQVKYVAALGENFAVFRTEKGVVRILDAYCPHLGANMAEGGQVKGDCLECPFHGWLFRGDNGNCEHIPYAEKVPRVAKAKTWQNCEVNEIIFVWYHAEGLEPSWYIKSHDYISNRKWRYQGRNEFRISCHIQEIAENGSDVAHINAVHGPPMFLNDAISWVARHSWTNISWKPHSSFAEEKNSDDVETNVEESSKESMKHRAEMTLRHSFVLFEKFNILELNIHVDQIGPGYVELMIDTSLGPMCILQTVTPVEPLLQKVIQLIYSPPLIGPYATLVFLGECLMFERDVAIWNHKKFTKEPLLVKEDRRILAYRRWYAQFYSEHSPSYQSAMQSLLW